jgi:hypothetical protein
MFTRNKVGGLLVPGQVEARLSSNRKCVVRICVMYWEELSGK